MAESSIPMLIDYLHDLFLKEQEKKPKGNKKKTPAPTIEDFVQFANQHLSENAVNVFNTGTGYGVRMKNGDQTTLGRDTVAEASGSMQDANATPITGRR